MTQPDLTPTEANAIAKFLLEMAPDYEWNDAINGGDWTEKDRRAIDSGYRKLQLQAGDLWTR